MKTIAITCRMESFDSQSKWFINATYVDACSQYGCALFPIVSYASLAVAATSCDALIVCGGYDLRSYYLQEIPDASCNFYDHAQDHFDFACIQAFLQKQKPILGICRGMQLLAVYYGSKLFQNIDINTHATLHAHPLYFPKNSILHQLYSDGTSFNSYHHQAVKQCGEQLDILAYSKEQYVEAFLHKQLPVLGVQWHPEKMENDQLFPHFLDVVCERSLRRL